MHEYYIWRTRERFDWSWHEVRAKRLTAAGTAAGTAAERAKTAQELGEDGYVFPIALGPDWISPLLKALTSGSESVVRCGAATALKRVGTFPAWDLGCWLTGDLKADKDGSVHRNAATLLKRLACPDLEPFLGPPESMSGPWRPCEPLADENRLIG